MKIAGLIVAVVILVAAIVFLAGTSILIAAVAGGAGFAGIVLWLSRS